ncbi:purine and uridine phosphorylase [Auricularia subglabra TFB-10046 SS5]|nr:purine and uridine phosphorylase [Auricularia subglabra TFB-10046 SS5]
MKDVFLDANFPRTADKRVYHLGTRAGEVANRILTVGHHSRALKAAELFDGGLDAVFKVESDRGFLLLTGTYEGVPISIISIGMGFPMVDFMVREIRECVDGEMAIVRLGSCGSLLDIPVGSLVVPRASVAVTRNYDFDFTVPEEVKQNGAPYRISKPAYPDPGLHDAIFDALQSAKPADYKGRILGDTINASADSFYSSQGRITAFPDHNTQLIEHLVGSVEGAATLEMETFHLFHLASIWSASSSRDSTSSGSTGGLQLQPTLTVPPADPPAGATVVGEDGRLAPTPHPTPRSSKIRAASAQMIFAGRVSQTMITPNDVLVLEEWTCKAVLGALAKFPIANPHSDVGAVWTKNIA